MGPVPPEARDSEGTLMHNIRWWFYPCKQGGMPPFKYDGAIDQWRKPVMAFSGDRIYIMQRDDPMSTPIPSYEDVEVMVLARPLRGAEGMGAATVGKGHRNTTCKIVQRFHILCSPPWLTPEDQKSACAAWELAW